MRAAARRGQEAFRLLETCGKPSVAAVNGFALGGGLELAMACTVRFASENATPGTARSEAGADSRLWRIAASAAPGGPRTGARTTAGGRPDRGRRSASHRAGECGGAAGRAVELQPRLARQGAGQCAAWPWRMAMEAVDVGLDAGLEEGLRFEAAAFGLCAATDDCREGTRAFLEKRKPAFAGK